MKKVIGVMCALAMTVGLVSVKAEDMSKLTSRLTDATGVIEEVMGTPDK